MSSLLNLFSLLASIKAACDVSGPGSCHPCGPIIPDCRPCGPIAPECQPCGPVCPDICLIEPSCNNEILCKLQIGFFLYEQSTTTLTSAVHHVDAEKNPKSKTVAVEDHKPIIKSEGKHEHRDEFIPIKNFKIHERRDACCTSNSIVITFTKPNCPPRPVIHEFGYLVLSSKGDNNLNIPHIFATTFNKFIGIEQEIIHHNHQVVYRIPLRDIESLIVSITDLGIANVGAFKRVEEGLDVFLESDIFTHGPYKGCVPCFSKRYAVPLPFRLPTNLQIRLAALHKDLRDSVKVHCVSKWDINRMAVAAFISEIRWLFSCSKAPCVKKCEVVEKVSECERAVVEYCVFVSACIKAIAYCEEKTDCRCVFTPQCTEENRHVALQSCVSAYASKCDLVNVQLNSEISVLFSDVCPALDFQICEPTCETLSPLVDESCESSSLSSDEDLIKERTARRRKAAVKVKSETSVSTYGWYVAGGVVAVSVAVVVYVFVL